MLSDASRKVLPPSATHPTREAHKRYIEAITNMKNATKPPTISASFQDDATKNHSFKAGKYIIDDIKKGIPHVQFGHKKKAQASTTLAKISHIL